MIANDYDDLTNGASFRYKIDSNAPPKIKNEFRVDRINNGSFMLNALTQFDREKQKQYSIPIEVCDLKDLCDVSILKLIIGDVNDNPMSPGFSEIFVYNYEGLSYIHYSITFQRLLTFFPVLIFSMCKSPNRCRARLSLEGKSESDTEQILSYRKVASRSTSRVVARSRIF